MTAVFTAADLTAAVFSTGAFSVGTVVSPRILWIWKLPDRLGYHLLLLITGHLPSKNLASSGRKLKSPAIPAGLFVP
jgi:hypothetical protein